MVDSMIEPILSYGSEVWGYENLKIIEQIHLKFCKRILKVRGTTPNFMIYGELGRYPLEIRVKLRMIMFWKKLLLGENKLSSILYRLMFSLKCYNNANFKWINYVETIFNEIGMNYIFVNQFPIVEKQHLNQILCDQFIQKWFGDIENSSRGQFYLTFKKDFSFEKYLIRLPDCDRIWITKLRTSNLHLPIETGRWYNIPREDRICTLCNENIGDEYHILFVCKNNAIVQLRNKYLPEYYVVNPNRFKFEGLLSFCNVKVYRKFSVYIKNIVNLL